jgi:hypothetical protein
MKRVFHYCDLCGVQIPDGQAHAPQILWTVRVQARGNPERKYDCCDLCAKEINEKARERGLASQHQPPEGER